MNNMDWQYWNCFLAVAEHGSVNSAATHLRVSQPTLSRKLLAMEKELGHSLFDRSTRGLTLTEFGASLIDESRQMEQSANRLERLVRGQEQQLGGRIRLSANEVIALHYLPKILPSFLDTYPQLSVELEVSNQTSSLDKRDADVAIRMFPPTQLDLVSRRLFDISLGFYASSGFLDRYGTPTSLKEIFNQRVLGFDRDQQMVVGAGEMGLEISNEEFLFRCDYMPIQIALCANGGGIAVTHELVAESHGLVRLCSEVELPKLPVFLVCHRDVQHNRTIRVMMDFLGSNLSDVAD